MNNFSTLNAICTEFKARKDRSAWDRGVNFYALFLLENLEERAEYEGREPVDTFEMHDWLLGDAKLWPQFSKDGRALTCDADIAARLCTPSELRRTRGSFSLPCRIKAQALPADRKRLRRRLALADQPA